MGIVELRIVIIAWINKQGMGIIRILVQKIKDLFSPLYNKLLVG
jgi:hypothetical protein